jgi:diguanylate cyclase
LLGQSGQIIYASNEDYLALGPRVAAAFAAGQPFDGELQFLRGDGRTFPGRLRGMPVDRVHTRIGTIWTLTDITEEVAARQSLEWAASHDTLTGLANRKAFEQQIERLFEALPRSRPAALLLLDLDRFKPINDNHGHAAGDAMLRAVASAVQACVRGGDLAVRLGGDEFAVLLERCPADVALRVAEDVRNAVAQTRLQWQGHALSVGASIGLAVLSEDLGSAGDWVAAADQACYEAKAGGRNRVHAAGMSAWPVPAPTLRLIAETSA